MDTQEQRTRSSDPVVTEIVRNAVIAVTEEMKDTAARYREEAKRIFLQIENCTLMTAEVRKTCTELKEKIAAPPTVTA